MSTTEQLKTLGFNDGEVELLLDLKKASDATFEDTGCGVEIGFTVASDDNFFAAAKSLAAKEYIDVDTGTGDGDPWKHAEIQFYTNAKFAELMGVRCHTDATEKPQTEAR